MNHLVACSRVFLVWLSKSHVCMCKTLCVAVPGTNQNLKRSQKAHGQTRRKSRRPAQGMAWIVNCPFFWSWIVILRFLCSWIANLQLFWAWIANSRKKWRESWNQDKVAWTWIHEKNWRDSWNRGKNWHESWIWEGLLKGGYVKRFYVLINSIQFRFFACILCIAFVQFRF